MKESSVFKLLSICKSGEEVFAPEVAEITKEES